MKIPLSPLIPYKNRIWSRSDVDDMHKGYLDEKVVHVKFMYVYKCTWRYSSL